MIVNFLSKIIFINLLFENLEKLIEFIEKNIFYIYQNCIDLEFFYHTVEDIMIGRNRELKKIMNGISKVDFKNKNILIVGGTGSFGNQFL